MSDQTPNTWHYQDYQISIQADGYFYTDFGKEDIRKFSTMRDCREHIDKWNFIDKKEKLKDIKIELPVLHNGERKVITGINRASRKVDGIGKVDTCDVILPDVPGAANAYKALQRIEQMKRSINKCTLDQSVRGYRKIDSVEDYEKTISTLLSNYSKVKEKGEKVLSGYKNVVQFIIVGADEKEEAQ